MMKRRILVGGLPIAGSWRRRSYCKGAQGKKAKSLGGWRNRAAVFLPDLIRSLPDSCYLVARCRATMPPVRLRNSTFFHPAARNLRPSSS